MLGGTPDGVPPRPPSTRLRALGLLLVLALAACATLPEKTFSVPDATEVDQTLLLIGDAGAPNPKGEPALQALAKQAALAPERTTVIFLGDNIYPDGMPGERSPARKRAEQILDAQIAVCKSGCKVYFVPGNHDWARWSAQGWGAIRRQAAYLSAHGGKLLPTDGEPGPDIVDVGAKVRLLFLDTQWWLHGYEKPKHLEDEVRKAIDQALETAGDREVVVLSHHPMFTAGYHAGYMGWKAHVFPLLQIAPWLWLPMPLIGSIYPISRKWGVTTQDVTSSTYKHLIDVMAKTVKGKPMLWAGGHEHNLQLHKGPPAKYQLVSGAGIYGGTSPIYGAKLPTTIFRSTLCGFGRLDVLKDGKARLGIRVVEQSGDSKEAFSTWLE